MSTEARPVVLGLHDSKWCDGKDDVNYECLGCAVPDSVKSEFNFDLRDEYPDARIWTGDPYYQWRPNGGDEILRELTGYTFWNPEGWLSPDDVREISRKFSPVLLGGDAGYPPRTWQREQYRWLKRWFAICAKHNLGVVCSY